ncbi:MAG: acyltransferase family protein [Armatimonas sp.]
MSAISSTGDTRRHDLDALRALAMLLGIVLHAIMTFVPGLWPIQDNTATPAMGALVLLIHGFRMPLFFLVSGFFTALLWRRYGLSGVIRHRLLRILLPCVLGTLTIVPLYRQIVKAAAKSPSRVAPTKSAPPKTVVEAAVQGDSAALKRLLAAGGNVNTPDKQFGATPLSWAALRGDVAVAELLLKNGAEVNRLNTGGSTALHSAVLLGQDDVVTVLLKHGANVTIRTRDDYTPGQLAYIGTATTQRLVTLLGLPPHSQRDIDAGRERCRKLLPPTTPRKIPLLDSLRQSYGEFLKAQCFSTPIFEHLWFLWFLCWLLPFFALWTRISSRVRIPQKWVVSPLRYAWVIPLTVLPQLFMGTLMPAFGADTAMGLVPPPHLLFYYGVFFFFGALYYEAGDTEGILGRRWWLTLSLALAVFLPLGIVTLGMPAQMTASTQVSYTWFMICGCLGLARRFLAKESPTLRYLSDSSYWLYIAHLPLIVALQLLLRDLALPLVVKLLVILGVTVVALLASYQLFVRHTLLGVLLNGKRAPMRV